MVNSCLCRNAMKNKGTFSEICNDNLFGSGFARLGLICLPASIPKGMEQNLLFCLLPLNQLETFENLDFLFHPQRD